MSTVHYIMRTCSFDYFHDHVFVSRLYRLDGNYFDRQDEVAFRTKDVYDVTGFSEWGNYYLVFAMAYSVSNSSDSTLLVHTILT